MKNRIYSSRSFNKTNCYRKNRISREQNQISNINLNLGELSNKLSEIYKYYYSYYFPSILNLSKICFFEKINKCVEESISFIAKNIVNSTSINQILIKLKENIEDEYNKDYQIISTSYDNYLKNSKNYEFVSKFRKHCGKTGTIAMHSCSNNSKGKFIFIQGKNPNSSYAICSECKQCYKTDFILMLCIPCNKKYYSSKLSENEDTNIFPATWEKYHCSTMVNEIMKCIKCHNILYLDLKNKKLVCKNRKCNFISNPESILWNCSICKEDFRSPAKVYNPLEFQILRKTINISLLLQKKARPKDLPCRCEKDLTKLTFYHKEECKGILYQGNLLEKEVLICSKCHAINFEEKFNWMCPICSAKFYLHNVTGAKPFSKKKYIINNGIHKNARASKQIKDNRRHSFVYIRKENYIEKKINNIKIQNIKDEGNSSDKSIKDSLSHIGNNNKSNINANNKNRSQNYSRDNSNPKLRHHSTLKEILKQREYSRSRNHKPNNANNFEKNKSQDSKIMSERIENMKNFYLSHNIANRNKSKMQNYINSYIGINKNQTSDFSLINDSENEKNNTNIKSKFSQLESPYFEINLEVI